MPTYEYRCLACDERFERRTTFADADATTARCPNGHTEVKRLLSAFAVNRAGVGGGAAPAPMPAGGGGGCCGGGCGCG